MYPIANAVISFLLLFPPKDNPLNDVFNRDVWPPGTVWVKDGIYFDRNEISNIKYQEYQYWMSHVFGITSVEYNATLLDASVLEKEFNLGKDYYSNPKYYYYPVVGISWEQALDYSKWFTDRVCEMILIEHGIIDKHPENTSENYFTYRKYLHGEYHDYKPVAELEIAIFSLPTKKEWEEVIFPAVQAKAKNKKSFQTKKNKKTVTTQEQN